MKIQLIESKQDIQNFIDKFGQDTYDLFIKSKDRLKNNRLSTDIVWHTKHTSPEEMQNMLSTLQQKMGNKDLSKTDFSKEQIPGKYNYLGEEGGYKIYQPLDYISSMALGVNTGWCTTGRYGHYGDPNFQPSEGDAKRHWNDYTSKGIEFYYLLNPKTMYGEIAVAVYPETLEVNKRTDDGLLVSTNAECFNAQDNQDFTLIDKLPSNVKNLIEINFIPFDIKYSVPKEDVREITLLSVEEAMECPISILKGNSWWWLRSPGNYSFSAALVNYHGTVRSGGFSVLDVNFAVRPALRISNLPNLQIGDVVECLGRKWYYVVDDLILSISPIGEHFFNADSKKPDANKFEGSDIQKYLQDWLREQMSKKESLKEDSENRKMSDGPLPMEPDKSLKKENKMNLEEFRKNRKARLQRLNESLNRPFKEALENMPDLTDDKAHGEVDAVEMDAIKSSKEREKQTKDALKDKNQEAKKFIKEQDKDTESKGEDKAEKRLLLDESLFNEDYDDIWGDESPLEPVWAVVDRRGDFIGQTFFASPFDVRDAIRENPGCTVYRMEVEDDMSLFESLDEQSESLVDDHREMLKKNKDKDAVRRSNETKNDEDKKPLKEEDAEDEQEDEQD